MGRNVFISMAKLSNVSGRIGYIGSESRQEHLYAIYATEPDPEFWQELAAYNHEEFEKSGTNGKCIEARELVIALPESFIHYDHDRLLKVMTDAFSKKYGVECSAALHHNKSKTNLHIHLVFSERRKLEKPVVKTASRNMFFDEQGKHVRTKKEIVDENGEVRKGCRIVKKGDIYERKIFTIKDTRFKQEAFLDEVKKFYTDRINFLAVNDKDKLAVFDRGGPYLATKKIGKNNPMEQEITADNDTRMEWNRAVDYALKNGVPEKVVMQVRQKMITEKVQESIAKEGMRPELFGEIVHGAVRMIGAVVKKMMQMRAEKKEQTGQKLQNTDALRKSDHNDTVEEIPEINPDEVSGDTRQEIPQEIQTKATQNTFQGEAQQGNLVEKSQELSQSTTQEKEWNTSLEILQEATPEASNNSQQKVSEEMPRRIQKDMPRQKQQESSKESLKKEAPKMPGKMQQEKPMQPSREVLSEKLLERMQETRSDKPTGQIREARQTVSVKPSAGMQQKASADQPYGEIRKVSQQMPPQPEVPEIVSRLPELERVNNIIGDWDKSIRFMEQKKHSLKVELGKCTGMFKANRRKELQDEITDADSQIIYMKRRRAAAAKENGFDSVKAFRQEYKASQDGETAYKKELERWEKTYGLKAIDETTIDGKIEKYRRMQKEEKGEVKERVRHKDRDAR